MIRIQINIKIQRKMIANKKKILKFIKIFNSNKKLNRIHQKAFQTQ
jgi:hypothetical protein